MPQLPPRILIAGANGHLGRQLIERLCGAALASGAPRVGALVRSERAAAQVRAVEVDRPVELHIGDYTDETSMRRVLEGYDAVVHLVGIIKEAKNASYQNAHEDTCTVLTQTATTAGVKRIIYLSIVGSRPDASNLCLASKGRAEQILTQGAVPTTVIRVPMVLGPGDAASGALRGQAHARFLPLIGGGATMQQPIDSVDVVSAVVGALGSEEPSSRTLDLGGPEQISHRALVSRAAALYGKSPTVIPIPYGFARAFARLLERVLDSPPITLAMLEVLQHDDRVDQTPSCEWLGLTLTPLDETLRAYVGPSDEVPFHE